MKFTRSNLAPIYYPEDPSYIPRPAHPGEDTGCDIRAWLPEGPVEIRPGETRLIDAGFRVRLPRLDAPWIYDFQIRSRSGLASRHNLVVVNQPGTIDPGYRGPVMVALHKLYSPDATPYVVQPGERIAQVVLNLALDPAQLPVVWTNDAEVEETRRSECGFGSTGSH